MHFSLTTAQHITMASVVETTTIGSDQIARNASTDWLWVFLPMLDSHRFMLTMDCISRLTRRNLTELEDMKSLKLTLRWPFPPFEISMGLHTKIFTARLLNFVALNLLQNMSSSSSYPYKLAARISCGIPLYSLGRSSSPPISLGEQQIRIHSWRSTRYPTTSLSDLRSQTVFSPYLRICPSGSRTVLLSGRTT